ncbi:hypothetical protein ACEW7V_01710 [Areca yellow leaf disease phytoplasma]|uniref:hypothetical protein n=1 Tax=Areca yellow leaf disease phytoplasma TaxID=927614 RepID=UPI0035B522D4
MKETILSFFVELSVCWRSYQRQSRTFLFINPDELVSMDVCTKLKHEVLKLDLTKKKF